MCRSKKIGTFHSTIRIQYQPPDRGKQCKQRTKRPEQKHPPPKAVKDLVHKAKSQTKHLVIGRATNGHHTQGVEPKILDFY